MFQPGELLVYGSTGVCQVLSIDQRQDYVNGVKQSRLYYQLKPLYQGGVIYTPVDNDKVVMRPVISREDAETLIDSIPTLRPAVELSYLTRDEQAELWDLIGREDATPSLSQALRMKQLSREAKLTPEVLYAILTEEKPNQKEQVRIKTESLRKYFPRNYSAQQMEREIIKLLEARYRAKGRGER